MGVGRAEARHRDVRDQVLLERRELLVGGDCGWESRAGCRDRPGVGNSMAKAEERKAQRAFCLSLIRPRPWSRWHLGKVSTSSPERLKDLYSLVKHVCRPTDLQYLSPVQSHFSPLSLCFCVCVRVRVHAHHFSITA